MGLLPLEFSDCLLDSPYFRENLKAHEKQLDQISQDIKEIIHNIQQVIEAARVLTKAKKTLAETLESFQFNCLGSSLTDDEILIGNSLKEFAKFLHSVEDEMQELLKDANDRFVTPLVTFRKEQIGSVKQTRKSFEKQTVKFCVAQDKFINMSSKKEDSLAEAAEAFRHETKALNCSSLEYVYLMHVVQERKKFEFVEKILDLTQAWMKYYKHGNTVACHYSNYMDGLKSRVKKSRDNFSATAEQFDILKNRMASSHQDPGQLNKMYTRQGYLFLQSKKNLKLGTVWTKCFCQYQAKTKILTMIPYSQLTGKITSTECLRVMNCVCKDNSTEKFYFTLSGEDLTEASVGIVSHIVQVLSEFERKNWVEALGGTWPAINTLQRIKADSVEENLNSVAFAFLKDCLNELEVRGLNDQGLYRVGGVASKVKRLLNQGLDPQPGDKLLNLGDLKELETKTIASAVKQYFRDLNKPLLTYHLYSKFVEAAKNENEASRINEIYLVLQKLPIANKKILNVLIRHLSKVSAKAEANLMTPSNLSVCFGPTLLWPKEKTVASIMDIKFCNEVVKILIENCDRLFPEAESSPEFLHVIKRKATNSLPDIREFHAGTTERPRSKSHQHEFPPKLQSKEVSPPPITLSKLAIVQDDLMSSLEMMTSLAADLPSTTGDPRKAHYLPNKNKGSHPTPQIEIIRKSHIPKLTTVALSPSVPPRMNVGPSLHATPVTFPPTKYLTINSDASPRTSPRESGGFLKPGGPSDLPEILISAFEGLCTIPSQKRRASNESLLIQERNKKDNPPFLPIKQFKKFVNPVSTQQKKTFHAGFFSDKQDIHGCKPYLSKQTIDSESKKHSETRSLDQISPNHDIQFTVTVLSPVPTPKQRYYPVSDEMSGIQDNSSSDGGRGSSFMKPQYSEYTRNNVSDNEEEWGAVLSKYRQGHHDEVMSNLSCSLSEESDASESKYDNINLYHINNNPAIHGDHLSRQKNHVVDVDEWPECIEGLENINSNTSESDAEYPDMGSQQLHKQ